MGKNRRKADPQKYSAFPRAHRRRHEVLLSHASQQEVDRVIRCQRVPTISTLDRAEIGGIYYDITQIQYPEDVEPPCMDLTLSLIKAV
jgi:hypothetical protein